MPDKGKTTGKSNFGGVEGGQATAGGYGKRKCGAALDWGTPPPLQSMEEDGVMSPSGGGP